MRAATSGVSKPNPAARAVMTEDTIVRAALEIIEQQGVDGLTMRPLSARLDVALGATYHRVPNKHALLVLVANELYSRVELPSTDNGEWKTQVRTLLLRLVDVLGTYPGMAAYIMRHIDDMAPVEVTETLRHILAEAGFSKRGVETALNTLFFYVAGTLVSGFTTEMSPLAMPRGRLRVEFERGLDVVLRGVEGELE